MASSRRELLKKGTAIAAAGVAAAIVGKEAVAAEKTGPGPVGACGISCGACPLMKAGKCKGCGPGTAAMKKGCPVWKCANMKGIEYCGTGCKMFTSCKKLVGKPYAKSFLDMMATRMG